jgi:hypothetical protein
MPAICKSISKKLFNMQSYRYGMYNPHPKSGFFHARSKVALDPYPDQLQRIHVPVFNPKKLVTKLSKIRSVMFIPDFFHNGSQGQKALDPGSETPN